MAKKFFLIISITVFLVNSGYGLGVTTKAPIIIIVGTRPEAIKMMPLYKTLKQENMPVLLCATGQHTDMVDDIFELFGAVPDFKLNCMKPGQDLHDITCSVLSKTREVFKQCNPSLVLVQGDTTSAMTTALSAFYLHIPVGHIEAGLRTGTMQAPFPEELNRSIISLFAEYHFAPTEGAVLKLKDEKIDPKTIFHTGNTVVDALYQVHAGITHHAIAIDKKLVSIVETARLQGHKIMLFTAHRRESLGNGFIGIFNGIKSALDAHEKLTIVYPRHPNPAIKEALAKTDLEKSKNIHILEPLGYKDMVYLLSAVDGVITDSGGLQEEALSLGKPVFVLRDQTERSEGIEAGLAQLIGTNSMNIKRSIDKFMQTRRTVIQPCMVYGDGKAAERIASILKESTLFK